MQCWLLIEMAQKLQFRAMFLFGTQPGPSQAWGPLVLPMEPQKGDHSYSLRSIVADLEKSLSGARQSRKPAKGFAWKPEPSKHLRCKDGLYIHIIIVFIYTSISMKLLYVLIILYHHKCPLHQVSGKNFRLIGPHPEEAGEASCRLSWFKCLQARQKTILRFYI